MNNITELKAQLSRKSLYIFLKEFWEINEGGPLMDSWHIRYLCDELQEVAERVLRGEKRKGHMVISISPGTSKSTIASIMLPVWMWVRDPSMKLLTGTHSIGDSLKLNTKSRTIINSKKFKQYFPEINLRDDDNQKSYYVTDQGGSRRATAAGRKVTGDHADLIILDDLVEANPKEGDIDRANEWLRTKLSSRMTRKEVSVIILIMQRVAYNDPIQTMLDLYDDTIEICLPAEINELTQDKVKPKELIDNYTEVDGTKYMNPDSLSPESLRVARNIQGVRQYASQFLQSPEPLDGGIIKESWIKVVKKDIELLEKLNQTHPDFFIDTAYTSDKTNDPSGIITVKKVDNQLYVMDAQEWWLEFPQLIKRIEGYVKENGYSSEDSRIYVEPKAAGKSAVQTLIRETTLNVIEDKAPSESKERRLQGISPVIESGRLKVVEGNWNEDYIGQLISSKPLHDEFWDTTVMAVRNMLEDDEPEQMWITSVNV